jgi:hypothetical protein
VSLCCVGACRKRFLGACPCASVCMRAYVHVYILGFHGASIQFRQQPARVYMHVLEAVLDHEAGFQNKRQVRSAGRSLFPALRRSPHCLCASDRRFALRTSRAIAPSYDRLTFVVGVDARTPAYSVSVGAEPLYMCSTTPLQTLSHALPPPVRPYFSTFGNSRAAAPSRHRSVYSIGPRA